MFAVAAVATLGGAALWWFGGPVAQDGLALAPSHNGIAVTGASDAPRSSACTLVACSVLIETFTPVDNAPMGDNAYLKASNTDPGDHFGLGIAVSRDGSLVIIGANTEASATLVTRP